MNQPLQDYTTQDLLAFYDRVKPVLSKWLAKPVWTARETAMLCAGYIPHESPGNGSSITTHFQKTISDGAPIDPHRYLPPDHELHSVYLELLSGKEAASPYDMVNLLRPAMSTAYTRINMGQEYKWATSKRRLTLTALREFQWFLIIGNAVGMQVPALVSMGLLNGLHERLTSQTVNKSPTGQIQCVEKKGEQLDFESLSLETDPIQEVKPKANQRKPREPQLPQTTPERRGYHTTEEVAGLTNLQPDTLNKYAREGVPVEGFTPFKRQNGRFWQWRDTQQQAAFGVTTSTDQSKRRPK